MAIISRYFIQRMDFKGTTVKELYNTQRISCRRKYTLAPYLPYLSSIANGFH